MKNNEIDIIKFEGQNYLDLFEILNEFLQKLEQYDKNLLNYYFHNGEEINNNNQFSTIFFDKLISKIKIPTQNQENDLYNNIMDYLNILFQKLIDNSRTLENKNFFDIINKNKNQFKTNYGFLQEKSENCISCFKIFNQNNDDLSDSDPISLKFCKHRFCRECLRNYILRSTNNLVFLTRIDTSNSRKRIIKCLKEECNFILFLEDYYNIFGENLFNSIRENYFKRLNRLKTVK